jgi:hypothetical protein
MIACIKIVTEIESQTSTMVFHLLLHFALILHIDFGEEISKKY